ncbi:hypothetical protein D3C80_1830880 [compost metagenome]
MQQGNTTVLANPLAVGNVDHPIRRHRLGVLRQAMHHQVAGVPLVNVVSADAPPLVTLDALRDTFGKVVVFPRQVIRLQQLQGKRHLVQVLIAGHLANHHLRQALAITQPGAAHEAFHLRPRQLARDFRA